MPARTRAEAGPIAISTEPRSNCRVDEKLCADGAAWNVAENLLRESLDEYSTTQN